MTFPDYPVLVYFCHPVRFVTGHIWSEASHLW